MKQGFIYIATNLIDGKQYVGQAINFHKRKLYHLRESKKEKPYLYFQRALKLHKPENFKWISFECPFENLNTEEMFWIGKLSTKSPNGYNLTYGGEGIKGFSGYKQTDEHKQKLSKAHKGLKKGKTFEDIMGSEIAARRRQEIKEQVSGNKNPNYGRKHTEEERKRMSDKIQAYLRLEPHPHIRYPLEMHQQIKELFSTGEYTKADISRMTGISWTHVARIVIEKE